MALSLSRTAAAVGLVGLAITGCGNTPPPPDPIPGTVQVAWTIAGASSPRSCSAIGASTFALALYDSKGALLGEWKKDCGAFTTAVDGIAPDDYVGRAQLLDAAGRARTAPCGLTPVSVVGGAVVSVSADFPKTSLY